MHIVLIIPRFYPLWGGTEIRIRRVAEALLERDFTFTVLTRRFNKTLLAEEELIPGIKIYRFPKLRPIFYHRVRKWINKNHQRIDLVHTFRLDKMGILGAWANKKFGIPHIADIIVNETAGMLASSSGKKNWAKITPNVDMIHCLSTGMAELIRKQGIPEGKIWYRPNAVDIDRFKPVTGSGIERDAGSKVITVLCCGRIERQKGTDILLKAWRRLPQECLDKTRLVLAGSGKWEEMLRKEAADLSNVIFAGTVDRDKLLEYYQNAQIYVQPSRYEGMSNAMLEALASGLPIIASEIDGSRDLVKPGENGYLFPSEDVTALANVLVKMLNNMEAGKLMGDRSRRIAEEFFSFSMLFNDYEKVYRSLKKCK